MPLTFSLLDSRPPFVYEQVAEKARELSRLGMSACAIARLLKTTDKTVTKALRHRENSGAKDTEPSL
jgi:DNA invertase Pin-like site-specific DNA recombinase